MGTVRIGLVGAGFMGKIHSLAYRNTVMLFGDDVPRSELVVVTDADETLAETAVATWGWTRSAADWQEIVTADDVDLVDICTPNDTHVEIALAALAHGKHVLCEKPLAPDAAGALELCRAARETGLVTAIGFVYRQWPAVAMARRLVDEGAIGEIRTARAVFLLDYNADPAIPMSWRFDRGRAGSGALGDVGSHCIDLLQHLVGPVSRVTSRMRTFVDRRCDTVGTEREVTVDDQTEMLVEFETGASGTILASWCATGHKCDLGFELIGTMGSVAFGWERSNELRFYDGRDPIDRQGSRTLLIGPVHPGGEGIHTVAGQGLGYTDAFVIATRTTLGQVTGSVQAGPSFVDGLRVAEVSDAVIESARSGASVDVSRHSL